MFVLMMDMVIDHFINAILCDRYKPVYWDSEFFTFMMV